MIEDTLTVRREVERADDNHMRVKMFFKTKTQHAEFGFDLLNTGAKIVMDSVKPNTNLLTLSEDNVHYSVNNDRLQDGSNLANGLTVEALIELPAGAPCFYPEAFARLWDAETPIDVQPRTPTKRLTGMIDGISYHLDSDQHFKVQEAIKRPFACYYLGERPVPAE